MHESQLIARLRDGDDKLPSWIYRIAVNTCLNRQRRKKLASMISLDFLLEGEDEPPIPSPEVTPDERLEQSETERIVQRAIQALPGRQKTAVILRRYEHLSYQEIGRIMKIGVPAVESLLQRAKENLAKKLLSY